MEKVVNMITVMNQDYLLLTKIREGDYWTLPGGRAKKGESEKVALKREVGEELPGITILELIPYKEFKGITPHSKVEVTVSTFFADVKGSIVPDAELTGSALCLIKALGDLNLTDITKDILESLKNDQLLLSNLSKVMDTYRII